MFMVLSLGSVMATEVMGDNRVKGLIIEGGITNQTEMISLFKSRKMFGSLVSVELDENLMFDTTKLINNYQKPIFVIHGNKDENIPLEMGKAIFNASNNAGSMLYVVEGGNHCDTFAVNKDRYLRE